MSKTFITHTRFTLIKVGKVLPFIVCFVVCISYTEDIFALLTNSYIEFEDGVYLSKSLSWFIGNYFKYDVITLLVLTIISIAIETCIYNKLSCAYLGVNLIEKSYFDFEIEPIYIYVICVANIIVAGYLIYRGIKNLLK